MGSVTLTEGRTRKMLTNPTDRFRVHLAMTTKPKQKRVKLMSEKKITKATFKSFIRNNAGSLHIMNLSDFDAMTDCVQHSDAPRFRPVQASSVDAPSHNFGIAGAWLVGNSRDWFQLFNKEGFTGIEVSNCCGNFVIAVPDSRA